MASVAATLPQPYRSPSRATRNVGRALSGLSIAFLAWDAAMKILLVPMVVKASAELGFSTQTVFTLGAILLASVALYSIPATSIVGAVLLTGYLGGAVATHVKLGSPLFSHVLFPVYVGSFVWGGLLLRHARLRALLFTLDTTPMSTVTSKDGTPIAYERSGSGPALILVDGALCSSEFGPMPKLSKLLSSHFTVFTYDRRGRGKSGDQQSYSRDREIEDLAALVDAAGGSAYVVGLSSGGGLALEAAASGVRIKQVVAYEPPYIREGGSEAPPDHVGQLRDLIAQDRRGAAVKYFMRDMVNVPAPVVFVMQFMPGLWKKMKAVAHTLPYDASMMGDWSVPSSRFKSISVPVVAMYGGKTDERLKVATRGVAKAIPNAREQELPGQNHNVNAEVLTRALVELLPR